MTDLERTKLNEALAQANYGMAGDLVYLSSRVSATTEVRKAEKSVVMEFSMSDLVGGFVYNGMNLQRFRKNPIVLWEHDYEGLPIARSLWERLRGEPDAHVFIAKAQFHCDTNLSRETWELVQATVDNSTWSLGVLPTEWEYLHGKPLVTKYDLLEYSCQAAGHEKARIAAYARSKGFSSPTLVKSLVL